MPTPRVQTESDASEFRAFGFLGNAIRRALRLRPGESGAVLLSALFNFLLMAGYYILRPLRDEIGSTHHESVPALWTLVFFVMLGIVPIYSAMVSAWRRRTALLVVYLFAASNLVLFHSLLGRLAGPDLVVAEKAFYIWTSVFALFAVSVFWSFMADVFRSEQGVRLFGIIAAGGAMGGIAGPSLTQLLLAYLNREDLVLFATFLLAVAVACLWVLDRLVTRLAGGDGDETGGVAPSRDARNGAPVPRGVLGGMKIVLLSPYLLAIAGFLFLHSLAQTFVYFEKLHLVDLSIVDRGRRAAFFARVDLTVNLATAAAQVLLLSRLLKRVGVGVTLIVRPVVTVVGFLLLGHTIMRLPSVSGGAAPIAATSAVFGVLVTFEVVLRAVNFALAKPTREILFTVVTREAKYKAKAFIDTVVYRGSDVVHAWFFDGLVWLGLSLGAIALVAAPFGAVGAVLALYLGRRQARLSEENERAGVAGIER